MVRRFFIVPHTHWDREWYQPYQVFRSRLVEVVDRILDTMQDGRFRHFLLDGHTVAALDYLEIRPEAAERLRDLVRGGRIGVGPFHILMDEFLVSGETIVRNLAKGVATALELGRCLEVAYLPDMFGHIGQMPQILRRAGIGDAFVWRGVPKVVDKTVFRWQSPDGSWVRAAYMATSYSNGAYLPVEPEALRERLEYLARELDAYSAGGVYLVMNGTDHSPCQPELPEALQKALASMPEGTEASISSLQEYLSHLPSEPASSWEGELRSGARVNLLMGVVSNRVDIRRSTAYVENLLARYAEPLAALYAPGVPRRYFEIAWDLLVQNSAHDSICACSVDEVTDQVATRLAEARQIAEVAKTQAMEELAKAVGEGGLVGSEAAKLEGEGLGSWLTSIVFFNPSLQSRSETVVTDVPIEGGASFDARGPEGSQLRAQVLDIAQPEVLIDQMLPPSLLRSYVAAIPGREVMGYCINRVTIDEDVEPPTITVVVDVVPTGHLDIEEAKSTIVQFLDNAKHERVRIVARKPTMARVLLETPEIPPLGWATVPVFFRPREAGRGVESAQRLSSPAGESLVISNNILEVAVHSDGTYDLRHVDGGPTFRNLGRLVDGGEWGDTYNYSPPYDDTLVEQPEACEVALAYDGPLATGAKIVRTYSIPLRVDPSSRTRSAELTSLVVEENLELRQDEPFLRVSCAFENTAMDHRLRVHFPVPFRPAGSFGGSAFEVAVRGLEAEGGPHEFPLPTFPGRGLLGTWGRLETDRSGESGVAGLAILVEAVTEYEVVGNELAITLLRATGMLSRPDSKLRPQGAGPSMPTRNSQCLGPHRWYYAVMPYQGDWREAGVVEASERFVFPPFALEASIPLDAAVGCRLDVASEGVTLSGLQPTDEGALLRVYAPAGAGWIRLSTRAEETTITGVPKPDGTWPRDRSVYEADRRIDLAYGEIHTYKVELGRSRSR